MENNKIRNCKWENICLLPMWVQPSRSIHTHRGYETGCFCISTTQEMLSFSISPPLSVSVLLEYFTFFVYRCSIPHHLSGILTPSESTEKFFSPFPIIGYWSVGYVPTKSEFLYYLTEANHPASVVKGTSLNNTPTANDQRKQRKQRKRTPSHCHRQSHWGSIAGSIRPCQRCIFHVPSIHQDDVAWSTQPFLFICKSTPVDVCRMRIIDADVEHCM